MSNKHVLIIDDDPMIAELLKNHLIKKGVHAETQTDPEKALVQIRTHRPDLVFLDYRMQPITGKDVLEQLHLKNPELPVIMMSGYHTPEGEREMSDMGALAYIGKPLDLERIDRIMERINSDT